MIRPLAKALFVIVPIAAIAAGALWYSRRGQAGGDEQRYRTAPVTRTDVVATISATGTVEPEEVIDVGAQVAGRITEFGKDEKGKTIDYGSEVSAGMILALIDPSLYESDVLSAKAQVEQANASVKRAEADVAQYQAKYDQADRDWQRAQKLGPSDALAQVDFDAYQSAFESAKANVAVGQAALAQAKTTIAQAQATLDRAKQNLGYCTISAPVNGVIIDRRVNIGQTVVSSLNAPSLFLIAKDLKRMQVWVAVNEADIGQIRAGQPVTFTADAFPGRAFKGEVNKVRLNATMTQNVVTYTVEVLTDNSSGKLLPYLTANVQFDVNRHDDVLSVPNAALRWAPTEMEQVAPDARTQVESASTPSTRPARASRASTRSSDEAPEYRRGTVWIRDGQYVRPLKVMAGATDGKVSEIRGEGVREDVQVVIGEQTAATASSTTTGGNPFVPQFRRNTGSGSGQRSNRPQ